MKICVDTTILIDILKNEFQDYQDRLYSALEKNENLAAPTVVYAELLPQFKGDTKLLNSFLNEHKIKIEPLDIDSVTVAGQRWMKYLKRKSEIQCPQCGHLLGSKEHFLSDFYIGGFALTRCNAILTRDRGIYRKYFPELQGYENCL
ncbi:MAG: type II toxin-antitoxin system VapC family toxin [Nitrospinae bacterium]|nr:type II toxin-antitoxin system VapC family toxin [Nitrospinota bacterium]